MTTFDLNDLPYAAEDIEHRRIVLDARRRAEALADDPTKIRFYIREVAVYERTFTPAELDECAPGWREALEHPVDHDAPGRFDLECAVLDDLDSNEEVDAYGQLSIHLARTDRTPTHLHLHRTLADGTTTEETVTVEADDLDDVAWGWRSHIGTDLTAIPGIRWWLYTAAHYAEAHRPAADDETPAVSVEIRSITQ